MITQIVVLVFIIHYSIPPTQLVNNSAVPEKIHIRNVAQPTSLPYPQGAFINTMLALGSFEQFSLVSLLITCSNSLVLLHSCQIIFPKTEETKHLIFFSHVFYILVEKKLCVCVCGTETEKQTLGNQSSNSQTCDKES